MEGYISTGMKIVILGLHFILMVQWVSASCYSEGKAVFCDNLASLNDIPPEVVPNSTYFHLIIRNSSLSLTNTKPFNSSLVQYMNIETSNISLIETSFFENFDSLLRLRILDNHINMIEPFPALKRIHDMYIEQNTIGQLPIGLFHGISAHPELLIILDNTIVKTGTPHDKDAQFFEFEDLPSDLFKNNSIAHLFLSGNKIVTVKPDTFRNLNNLLFLHLNRNSISVLPRGAFQSLSLLNALYLDSNMIVTLNSGIFTGLAVLRTLTLANNQLTIIENGWFDNVPSLTMIDLDSNKIANFDLRLKNLEVLVLSNNRISNIEKSLFEEMPSLAHLELSHNYITKISPNTFKGLANLNILNLGFNQISRLQKSVFEGFLHLKDLRVNGNNITNLEDIEFHNLDSLRFLNISNNHLEKLKPGAFGKLGSLEELDLGNTWLCSVNLNAFRGLPKLQNLLLRGNGFSNLEPDGMKNVSSIALLDQEDTPIEGLNIIENFPVQCLKLRGTKFENESLIMVNNHSIGQVNMELWEVRN